MKHVIQSDTIDKGWRIHVFDDVTKEIEVILCTKESEAVKTWTSSI
jgi:hypothetical protein